MNIDKLAPIAAVIVAIIAVAVVGDVDLNSFADGGGLDLEGNNRWFVLVLMAIGLVHGLMSPVTDHASQAMIIVAAYAFPRLANTLDSIHPVLNNFVDQFAIAIAGYAIAALINEVKSRIMAD